MTNTASTDLQALVERQGETGMAFDKSSVEQRLQTFWSVRPEFGMERSTDFFHIEQVLPDRLGLVHGFHVLNDELHFAPAPMGADFSLPSVVTTLAHTMCGDRIHQGGTMAAYDHAVGGRFGVLTRKGDAKFERFFPAGGGTDDGATLAHVTWAHASDVSIRRRLCEGNAASYILTNFDLQGHVGRGGNGSIAFGMAEESPYREPRNACGAIVGALAHFDEHNVDHRRIRADLGESNFGYFRAQEVQTEEGIDITPVVAASIVVVRGVEKTLHGMVADLAVQDSASQQRTVAHLTGSLTVNRVLRDDTTLYLVRATLFGGKITVQGFGTDATQYHGHLVEHHGEKRLLLTYGGKQLDQFPAAARQYTLEKSGH